MIARYLLRTVSLGLLVLLTVPLHSLAVPVWTSEPPMVLPRSETSTVMVQDDLYVFNGFGPGIDIEPTIEKYTAATGQWSIIAGSSVATGHAVTHNGIVLVGQKVWLIGGRIGDHPGAVTNKVWIYDLVTGQWSAGPTLPIPGAAGGAAIVNNTLHWFGGLDILARCDVDYHYTLDLNDQSAGWSNLTATAPMPSPRNHFSTVVLNGKILAIGGQFGHGGCVGSNSQNTDLVHQYDPVSQTWSQLASLPGVQSHTEPSTFVHGGLVYMVGGQTSGDEVLVYDPQQDTWSVLMSLPERLLAPVARIINGKLIVAGGGAPSTSVPVTRVWSTPITTPTVNNNSGLISREAETYDLKTGSSSHQWVHTNLTGSSSGDAMVTTPNSGILHSSSSGGVMMSYLINFTQSGTHYLWIRGWGDEQNGEGKNDSLHAGLNGSLLSTSDKIDGFPAGWNWSSDTRDGAPARLTIPSVGVHAVNIWMREDGLAVDKFVITPDASYVPSGVGPVSGGGTTTAPVNSAPFVNAGVDAAVTVGGTLSLAGQASDDGLPSGVLTTNWTQASGPGSANFNQSSQLQTDVSFTVSGTYVLALQVGDGALSSQDTISVVVNPSVNTNGGPLLIAREAETYDLKTGSSSHQWVHTNLSGSSSGDAMVTTPNSGILHSSSSGGVMMSYLINFTQSGTHYLWIRGWGDEQNGEGKNDSLHAGLNGSLLSTSDKIDGFPAGWSWSSDTRDGVPARLTIPSVGVHAVNIWMREDGLAVDKFVVTPDASYVPSGVGPVSGGGTTTAPVNSAPVVNAGVDAATTVGATLSLAGQVSDDGLPSGALGTSWSQTSGPGSANFVQANQLQTDVSFTLSGTYVLALQASDGSLSSQDTVSVVVNPLTTTGGGPLLIAREAETYDTRTGSSSHQWVHTNLSGSSSGDAMVTTPNSGSLHSSAAGGVMMSYLINFTQSGTHYLWIRGWGDEQNGEGKNDSLHAGLNGSLLSTSDKIDGFSAGWNWSSDTRDGVKARLTIPSAGVHVVNLWMREDGLAVDKFVITPDASYVPSGVGPVSGTSGGQTFTNIDALEPWGLVQTSDGSYVEERHEAGAVELNGKVYVLGGRNNKPVESYDPVTGQWTNHGTPSVFFHHFQPVALNGYIYVAGAMMGSGYPSEATLPDVYRYDPLDNSWTLVSSVPATRLRGSTGAVAYNGKLYLVGGNTLGHKGPSVKWFDEYDPASNSWSILPDAPTARDHATVAIANGKLVVAGGRRTAHPNVFGDLALATDVYNFATGVWEGGFPDIPTGRAGTMTVSHGDEVVVIGGESLSQYAGHTEVEALNVITGLWRSLQALIVGRHSGGAAISSNKIHVISGNSNRGGGAEISTHETLNLP